MIQRAQSLRNASNVAAVASPQSRGPPESIGRRVMESKDPRRVCSRCRFRWSRTRHKRISGATLSELLGLLDGLLLFSLPEARVFAATYEQRVIAAVIAGEAANQGRVGMVAVAEVIHQRVGESGWTPIRVVTRGNQHGLHAFSCLNRTTPPALVKKWHHDPAYETALVLAQLLCEAPERLPYTTRSANSFFRLGGNPAWARGLSPVVVIKDHAFYNIRPGSGSRRGW